MIRFARKSDFADVSALWRNVFGDEEKIINKFLSVHYSADNTVVFEDAGDIKAMFFLLGGEAVIEGNRYPSRYLYAACTAPEYRGRGIMADMIDFARKASAESGYDFICLLPAEESLYGYYERFGFKALYGVRRFNYVADDSSIISQDNQSVDLHEMRENSLSNINRFAWSKKSVEFAEYFNKYYGGNCLKTCKGYALYNKNEDSLTVKEIACRSEDEEILLNSLAGIYGKKEMKVIFPCNDESAEKHGMILPLNEAAKSVFTQDMKFYLGLTLD